MKPLTAAMIAVQQNAELLRGKPGKAGKAGPDGLTWRGPWQAMTDYLPGDVVEQAGSAYVCIAPTSRKPPSEDWDLLAAKGADAGSVYIPRGGGSAAITVSDEGTPLDAAVTSIDFAGDGVTATVVGHVVTVTIPAGGVSDADYLVGTAHAGLSTEIVVGATPGGELGGTWASPTVDTTHSGSSHAGVVTTHEAASDPHTGYRLESANHTHASSGLQGGTLTGYIPQAGPLTADLLSGGFALKGATAGAGLPGDNVTLSGGAGNGTAPGAAVTVGGGTGGGVGGSLTIDAGDIGSNGGASLTATGADTSGGGGFVAAGGAGAVGNQGGPLELRGGTGDDENDSPATLTLAGGSGSGPDGAITATGSAFTFNGSAVLTAATGLSQPQMMARSLGC